MGLFLSTNVQLQWRKGRQADVGGEDMDWIFIKRQISSLRIEIPVQMLANVRQRAARCEVKYK